MHPRRRTFTSLVSCFVVSLLACGSEVYRGFQHGSPDGKLIASFFGLHGSGAAGWAFQFVTVRRSDQPFATEPFVLQLSNAHEVCLEWLGPRELLIIYSLDADVIERRDSIGLPEPVTINYRVSPPVTRTEATAGGKCGALGKVTDPWR